MWKTWETRLLSSICNENTCGKGIPDSAAPGGRDRRKEREGADCPHDAQTFHRQKVWKEYNGSAEVRLRLGVSSVSGSVSFVSILFKSLS
jgi:hypothetical protein